MKKSELVRNQICYLDKYSEDYCIKYGTDVDMNNCDYCKIEDTSSYTGDIVKIIIYTEGMISAYRLIQPCFLVSTRPVDPLIMHNILVNLNKLEKRIKNRTIKSNGNGKNNVAEV